MLLLTDFSVSEIRNIEKSMQKSIMCYIRAKNIDITK